MSLAWMTERALHGSSSTATLFWGMIWSIFFVWLRGMVCATIFSSLGIRWCLVLWHLKRMGMKTWRTKLWGFDLLRNTIRRNSAVCIDRGLMSIRLVRCICVLTAVGLAWVSATNVAMMIVLMAAAADLNIITACASVSCSCLRLWSR